MKLLDNHDSGKTIEIDSGSTFAVWLKEGPSPEHRWEVESAEGLEKIGDRFSAAAETGQAGIRIFGFRVSSVGLHKLRLQIRRAREGHVLADTQFDAKILGK